MFMSMFGEMFGGGGMGGLFEGMDDDDLDGVFMGGMPFPPGTARHNPTRLS